MRKFHRAPSGLYVPRSQAGFIHPGLLSPPRSSIGVSAVSFGTGTSTGFLDITGAGFQPVGALFILCGFFGNSRAYGWSFGATDGSAEWNHAHSVIDNDSSPNNTHVSSAGGVIGSVFTGGTYTGFGEFNSWLPDGVRLNISNAFGASVGGYVLFFGPGWSADCGLIDPNNTEDGSVEVSTGHESALVFVSSPGEGHGFPDSGNANAEWSFGAWDGTNQRAVTYFSRWNASPVDSAASVKSNRCCVAGGIDPPPTFELGNGDSDSFDATTRDNNTASDTRLGYLSLSHPTARAHVGDFTTPTVTGVQNYTHPGFKPSVVLCINTLLGSLDTRGVTDDTDFAGVGVLQASSLTSLGVCNEDNVSTSNVFAVSGGHYVSREADSGTPELTQADLDEFTSSGFDLDFTTANGDARKSISIAIG